MRILNTDLPGVVTVEPAVYRDARGYFTETWHRERYREAGLPGDFVQDNVSYSVKGVIRGLHLQEPYPQGKLIQVLEGEVFDVAVDVRVGSPNFLAWVGVTLSSENHRQVFVPPGFAHGFAVLSEFALVVYKCTEAYRPECEMSLLWDDPKLAIRWPLEAPVLSVKDLAAPRIDDIPRDRLPSYCAPYRVELVSHGGRGSGASN